MSEFKRERTYSESNAICYDSDTNESDSTSLSSYDEHKEDKYPYVKLFPRKSPYCLGIRQSKPVRIILFDSKYRLPTKKPKVIEKPENEVKNSWFSSTGPVSEETAKEEEPIKMEHNYKVIGKEEEPVRKEHKPEEVAEEGWTKVDNKKKKIENNSAREIRDKIPNRLCRFEARCRRRDTCPYAHSISEIRVKDCPYKARCRWVLSTPEGYINSSNCSRPCNLLHPNEPIDAYLKRVMIK